ncbi:Epoxide hydrolase N terminus [Paenibacillus algorifonticola]|uniref:Epoxide hydrolase N terminus n=1 Tax=Paenibacillus algorifonticola TaxID=684063 RepID=A0A1I2A3Q4_9BACL|nr:epoxide hydrolase N-terminal domain-containing protein [Paenibacillus algorifonticola]SFE38409.1 Epoxide hydrolase N terminus [Paenibacillus algorifonticola]
MTESAFALEPTPIYVSEDLLTDLNTRLKSTRWPLGNGNEDWYYGVSRSYLAELVDYWINEFDWRKSEAAINAYEHYKIKVDEVPIHFMRKPGVGPNPTPLILTHGWPWTWHTLMTDILGYKKYAAAGCDVGALVTGQLGHKYNDELYAIHIGSAQKLSLFNGARAWDLSGGRPIPDNIPDEVRSKILEFDHRFASHLAVHVLDPSTLAFGLSDSPVGMLAWILERWARWSSNDGNVKNVFTKDDILTHATIFWGK